MADWSELKVIAQPFPCLWDPQDPYFSDETVKAVCREQILEIYNKRSGAPIDMESLKHWLSDNLARSIQLQTTTEKLPQGGQSESGGDGESLALKTMNAPQIAPIITLPQICQEVPTKLDESITQGLVPDLDELIMRFPCLWNPKDVDYRDLTKRKRSLKLILRKFNRLSSFEITMACLEQELQDFCKLYRCTPTTTEKLPQGGQSESGGDGESMALKTMNAPQIAPIITLPQICQEVPTKLDESITQGLIVIERSSPGTSLSNCVKPNLRPDTPREMPRLQDLVKEFPCLWDPNDLNRSDNKMRERSRQQLLERFNSISTTKITMSDLKRKLDSLRKKIYRHQSKLQDMLKEFPCLWDPNDPNFLDEIIKVHSLEQLLEKYNRLSPVRITMADLNRKLSVLRAPQKPVLQPKLQDMLKEFPCLWDRNDLNYSDNRMRARYRQQLLEKFNSLSSIQITMSDLKRKLTSLHHGCTRRQSKDKGLPLPPLSTEKQGVASVQERELKVQDISDLQTEREREVHEITTETSAHIDSGTSLDSSESSCRPQDAPDRGDLRRLPATSQQGRELRDKPKLQDLMKEFPCLWDPNDLNYSDYKMRARYKKQLLEKFNSLSTIQITMSDLKRKLASFHRLRRKRRSKDMGLAPLSTEKQGVASAQERELLVEKVQDISDLQTEREREVHEITTDTRAMINSTPQIDSETSLDSTEPSCRPQDASDRGELRRQPATSQQGRELCDKPKLQDLMKEFPCLWDTNDLNYSDNNLRNRYRQRLLEKFNRLSAIQINMSDLNRKLSALRNRRYNNESKGRRLPTSLTEKQEAAKRQTTIQGITEEHLETTEEERGAQDITAASFRAMFDNSQTNPTASMDSTESNQRPQDAANQDALVLRGIEVIFDYCRFCGELKDCTDARNDPKPYLANNKCTLIINDLRAELQFTDDMVRNICKDCDRKFQEMFDFVKRVKDAQVKFNNLNNGTLDIRQENYYTESENEADGQRKKCRITIDFNSDTLPSLSGNDDETNDIEMNSDDDDASQKVIDAEPEEIDKSRVSINKSPPSSSLCKEHVNSTMSYHHRADTPTNFITTYTEFLKTSSLSEKIYDSRPLSYMMMHNKSTEDVCEDDVNSIDIKKEHETADDVNDKQEQMNTDDNIYDDIDIKEEDIEAAVDAARIKAQLQNNYFVSNRSTTD